MGATNDLIMRLLLQDKASAGLKQAQRNVSDFGSAIGSVNRVLGVFGVTLGGAAIVGGIANLTALGARAETVGVAFSNMTKSVGQDTDAMLARLKGASRGAIAETDLMVAANRAIIMGGDQLAGRLPELMQLARAASIATGQDMQYMLDSIVLGIARRSRLILDNLGIIIDLDRANQAYAKTVGKAVDQLTAEEQVTATLADVLRVMPDYIKSVGAEATTSAEKVQQFQASLADLKTEAGKMVAEGGGADIAGFFANAMRLWTEQNQYKKMLREGVAEFNPQLAANWAARFTNTLGTTPTFSNEDIEKNRAALQRMVAEAQKYIDTQKAMGASEKQKRDAIEASVAIMRGAIPGTDSYNVAVQRLGKSAANTAASLRLVGQATQYASMAQAGASYANGILSPERLASKDYRPGYVFASDYLGGLGYQQGEARRAGQKAGTDYATGFNDALSSAQSKAQSALTSRMSPTGLDFLLTGMGQYQNAPLENVRRLDAIIARGFSEIKAHADWASVLKIPPEVLTGSETALKAWAMQTRDAAANLARPDLVDWDAFLKEFDRLTAEEMGRQMTLDLAMGKLASSGRLGQNQDQAKRILQSMLGLDTPETQALALGEALNKAFTASDPAGIYLNAFKAGTDQNQSKIDEISKLLGSITPDGKKAAEKYLADFNATLAALFVGTTGGGYVLP